MVVTEKRILILSKIDFGYVRILSSANSAKIKKWTNWNKWLIYSTVSVVFCRTENGRLIEIDFNWKENWIKCLRLNI